MGCVGVFLTPRTNSMLVTDGNWLSRRIMTSERYRQIELTRNFTSHQLMISSSRITRLSSLAAASLVTTAVACRCGREAVARSIVVLRPSRHSQRRTLTSVASTTSESQTNSSDLFNQALPSKIADELVDVHARLFGIDGIDRRDPLDDLIDRLTADDGRPELLSYAAEPVLSVEAGLEQEENVSDRLLVDIIALAVRHFKVPPGRRLILRTDRIVSYSTVGK